MQTLNTEVDVVSEQYYIQESVDIEMGERLSRVEGILHTLIQFCQRNSTSVDERERQVMEGRRGREEGEGGRKRRREGRRGRGWRGRGGREEGRGGRGKEGGGGNILFFMQAMWFPIFDKIHNMQQKYQRSTNMRLTECNGIACTCSTMTGASFHVVYTVMIHEVLNSMLGYVSLPDILQKIIQVPHYNKEMI